MSTKFSSKLIVHVSIPEKLSRDFSLPGDLSHLRQKWSSMNAPNLSPNWHDKPTSHCEENPLKKHMAFFATHAFYTHVFFGFKDTTTTHQFGAPPDRGSSGARSGLRHLRTVKRWRSTRRTWRRKICKKWLRNIKKMGLKKGKHHETSLIFLSMESLTPVTQVSVWKPESPGALLQLLLPMPATSVSSFHTQLHWYVWTVWKNSMIGKSMIFHFPKIQTSTKLD